LPQEQNERRAETSCSIDASAGSVAQSIQAGGGASTATSPSCHCSAPARRISQSSLVVPGRCIRTERRAHSRPLATARTVIGSAPVAASAALSVVSVTAAYRTSSAFGRRRRKSSLNLVYRVNPRGSAPAGQHPTRFSVRVPLVTRNTPFGWFWTVAAAPSRMFACPSAASISAKRRAVLPETGRENVTQDVGRDRAAHDGVDLVPRDGKMVRARDRAPPRRQAMAVSATDQPVAPQHCHCIAMIHSARSACASSATNRTAGPASRRHGLT
jgi:hypothetical protein